MIFICFAVFLRSHKSQKVFCHTVGFFSVKQLVSFSMTENLLLLDLYHFCCFLVKWQVTENFLPVSQTYCYKTAIIFQYDRKFITSSSLSLLLSSYKVICHKQISAILFLQISFCFLKYFCVFGSYMPINIVSVEMFYTGSINMFTHLMNSFESRAVLWLRQSRQLPRAPHERGHHRDQIDKQGMGLIWIN